MLRIFSKAELDTCGGITLPYRDWSIGTQLEHPKHGTGKLAFRDDEGRMVFEFPEEETFTIGEMREAFRRSVHDLPMTDKQKQLAQARHAALRAGIGPPYEVVETCRHGRPKPGQCFICDRRGHEEALRETGMYVGYSCVPVPVHPWVRRAMSRANCFFQTIKAGKPKNGSTTGP